MKYKNQRVKVKRCLSDKPIHSNDPHWGWMFKDSARLADKAKTEPCNQIGETAFEIEPGLYVVVFLNHITHRGRRAVEQACVFAYEDDLEPTEQPETWPGLINERMPGPSMSREMIKAWLQQFKGK